MGDNDKSFEILLFGHVIRQNELLVCTKHNTLYILKVKIFKLLSYRIEGEFL